MGAPASDALFPEDPSVEECNLPDTLSVGSAWGSPDRKKGLSQDDQVRAAVQSVARPLVSDAPVMAAAAAELLEDATAADKDGGDEAFRRQQLTMRMKEKEQQELEKEKAKEDKELSKAKAEPKVLGRPRKTAEELAATQKSQSAQKRKAAKGKAKAKAAAKAAAKTQKDIEDKVEVKEKESSKRQLLAEVAGQPVAKKGPGGRRPAQNRNGPDRSMIPEFHEVMDRYGGEKPYDKAKETMHVEPLNCTLIVLNF